MVVGRLTLSLCVRSDPRRNTTNNGDPRRNTTNNGDLAKYYDKEKEETGDYDNYADKWIIENVESNFKEGKRKSHSDGYHLIVKGGSFSTRGNKVYKGAMQGTVRSLKKRKMKHLTLVLILSIVNIACKCQVKYDSIIVTYIPCKTPTVLSFDELEVRNAPFLIKKRIVFFDTLSISDFSKIQLQINKLPAYKIDARIVFDLYINGQFTAIVLGKNLQFLYKKEYYGVNEGLILWI